MGMLWSKLEARQILKHFKRVGDEGGEAKKHPLQIKNKQSQAKNLNRTATDTNYFLTVNHSGYLEQGNIQKPELKQAEVPIAPTKIQIFKNTLKVEKGL